MSMIHFENVSKVYTDRSVALRGITMSVDRGEFLSIVGHSGAGKTTLLKMLLAEEEPTGGSVYFESVDINSIPRKELPTFRRRIGTVFQDFKLLPHKTAYENISFAMEVSGREDQDIESDVPYALDLVDLDDKAWSFPDELSGGEKQRLAIARAIVTQPDVVIADEPTGNLDPINTQEVVEILRKINDLGTTIMLTTHNKNVIDSLGKRVITMESGQIIRDDEKGGYVI